MADLAQRLDASRRIVVVADPATVRRGPARDRGRGRRHVRPLHRAPRRFGLRGRDGDEVPRIIAKGAAGGGVGRRMITVIPTNRRRWTPLRMGQPGDLLLVFADALTRTLEADHPLQAGRRHAEGGAARGSAAARNHLTSSWSRRWKAWCATNAACASSARIEAIAVESEPFEDSRRLTGANLYFDGTGAALETAPGLVFDAAALLTLARQRRARARGIRVGPMARSFVREHATVRRWRSSAGRSALHIAARPTMGAVLRARHAAGDAPVDDDGEQPRPHVAHFDDEDALRQLLRALRRRKQLPAMALIEAARAWRAAHATTRRCPSAKARPAQAWPLDALPAIDAVPWRVCAIPKAVVTGSNGKTTTVRLFAAMLRRGLRAGYSSTDGLFIDGERVRGRRLFRPVGARTGAARSAAGGGAGNRARRPAAARAGRRTTRASPVVTNVSADHFGEYGIHTLDDRRGEARSSPSRWQRMACLLVLNADDPLLVEHAASPRAFDASAGSHSISPMRWRVARLRCARRSPGGFRSMAAPRPRRHRRHAAHRRRQRALQHRQHRRGIAGGVRARHRAENRRRRCWCVFGASSADNPGACSAGPWAMSKCCSTMPTTGRPARSARRRRRIARQRPAGLLLGHAGNRLDDDSARWPRSPRRRSRIGSG